MKQTKENGDENRTVTVRVRVKPSEKIQMESNAANAGFTVSDWIRIKTINAKPFQPKPKPEQELLLRLLAESGKQGSNLNQIARHLNRKSETEDMSVPLGIILHAIETLKAVIKQIKEALG